MKKFIIIVTLLVLVLIFSSLLIGDTFQASIVPVDAQWVIHLDIAKFKSTRIGTMLIEEKDIAGLKKASRMVYKETSLDLYNDIAGITIYGSGKDEESTVVCLSGRFDRKYLLGLLEEEDSHRTIPHGKYTIHKWDRHDYGAFASDSLVLIGKDLATMKGALDVIAGGKNISSAPLGAYLQKASQADFVTIAASNVPLLMEGRSEPRFLKHIKSAFLSAAEQGENFKLNLTIGSDSQEIAANLEQLIKGFVALGKMHIEEIGSLSSLLERLNISVQKDQVTVQLVYPTEELVEILTESGKFLLGLEGFVL